MKSPIKYHGGKSYLADWIISHFPEHIHYVEPYFGGGSVLMRKDPTGSEVVNDLDRRLMGFWRTISDDSNFERFKRAVEAIPFSQQEYEEVPLRGDDYEKHPVASSLGFFIYMRQSRQGLGECFATLSKNRTRRDMNEQVSSWLTAIEGLPEVHNRLKRVVILNDFALNVIKKQDGPNTFFYLDPPYLQESRESQDVYPHEMTREDHQDLLDTLANIKGKFLLSGYYSELYVDAANKNAWSSTRKHVAKHSSSKSLKPKAVEYLWANYDLRNPDA